MQAVRTGGDIWRMLYLCLRPAAKSKQAENGQEGELSTARPKKHVPNIKSSN